MRFIPFFTLAFAVLQTATAVPVTRQANDIAARNEPLYGRTNQYLVRCGKDHQHHSSHKPAPPGHIDHITFAKGHGPEHQHSASNALDALHLHGHKRKEVENFHKHAVADHMAHTPGAHSAVIKNLAHSQGSRDPHVHISAQIKDAHGHIIEAPRRGNPAIMDPTHHIYVDKASLPHHFTKAVEKKQHREGRHGGV
ncbi:hypothetical protein CVT25_008384 [Psilocybe cyanescens]|uniref:Uncharacterized protein n=1 Tax=Psilocybe cyanescens TaxID=93625 RepID=A0A409VXL8_PSICY|nr:hypothetical protein CVT25_008384 [Psilocybe cyanescens]